MIERGGANDASQILDKLKKDELRRV